MAKIRKLSITTPLLFAFPLRSEWAVTPIDPAAPINSGGWEDAGKLKFSRGYVMAKNDAKFLYLALDVLEDTGNDHGTNDYFWLSFDYNRDRAITSNVDVNYGLYKNQPNKLALQKYLGPGQWTGISVPPKSEVIQEFGPSPNSDVSHRIWKFKIELKEINVSLSWPLSTPYTYFGFRVRSSNPAFTTDFPGKFYKDFTKLRQLILSRKPTIPSSSLGSLIGSIGLIPAGKNSANQDIINQVTGRATTDSSYYVHVENAAFGGTLNLIGNRTKLQQLWSANNRKYKVEIAPPGGSYTKLISNWSNYRWTGSTYALQSFAPSSYGYYQMANPGIDYSIDDLLIQFPTTALLPGLYKIRVTFYVGSSYSNIASQQELKIYIDNHVPATNIESVKHGSSEVSACAIETIGAAPDGLNFRITANDPEGNLRGVSFYATYGAGLATTIYSEGYSLSKGNWTGFTNKLIPVSGNWRPPQSCAYSFILVATARTTNGYSYIGKNTIHRNLTLLL
ncbi:hypothetical protein AAGF08_02515 [Algoriphagus sp. SE2]|uniref:hypothetical protein n=1 Tax=Algoriphagus sp. SE2 TaxID=3141536 RepID=UPI0031CD9275